MDNDGLTSTTGFEQILDQLDENFLPDDFEKEFWPLHDLFTFRKTPEMRMQDYLIDLEQKF